MGSANHKSAKCHICGKPVTNYWSPKFGDLWFSEFICWPAHLWAVLLHVWGWRYSLLYLHCTQQFISAVGLPATLLILKKKYDMFDTYFRLFLPPPLPHTELKQPLALCSCRLHVPEKVKICLRWHLILINRSRSVAVEARGQGRKCEELSMSQACSTFCCKPGTCMQY